MTGVGLSHCPKERFSLLAFLEGVLKQESGATGFGLKPDAVLIAGFGFKPAV
jgi:hypothetical protein